MHPCERVVPRIAKKYGNIEKASVSLAPALAAGLARNSLGLSRAASSGGTAFCVARRAPYNGSRDAEHSTRDYAGCAGSARGRSRNAIATS